MVKRALGALVVLFAISVFTFVVFFVVPSDRTEFGRGPAAVDYSLRETYGLQGLPLPQEYAEFVWDLIRHGSLGESYDSNVAVSTILASRVPVTASLVIGGAVLWMLIAIPIGILAALRPRSLVSRATMVLVLIGVSAHPAWIGLVLSYFVGFKWHLTPIGGYCDLVDPSTSCGGPSDWAHHLLLPWLTFAILFAALYSRMIRASIIESMNDDYVRTAHAKGAPGWVVLRSHVFRNALIPVVAMLGMDVGVAFGGAIFVETVYSLPGMGQLTLSALSRRDLPVIMGVVLVVTFAIVVFSLIVDLLQAWLDPRVRVVSPSTDGEVGGAVPVRPAGRPVPTGSSP